MMPHSDAEHSDLLNDEIKWAALTKVIAPLLILVFFAIILLFWVRRKRKLRHKHE